MEDRFFDIVGIGLMLVMVLLGVTSLIAWFVTWMWHLLMIAGMCAALVWVWYYEDYLSKGKRIWQKKNTRN